MENLGVNVDKKQLLINSLAIHLEKYLEEINSVVRQAPTPQIKRKPDGSPVTKLDEELSSYIENIVKVLYPECSFFSEEKPEAWGFPLLALDPLDGTREYICNRPEWAISIGYLKTAAFTGEGWVYNPANRNLFTHTVPRFQFLKKKVFEGEVSRSEWEKNLFLPDYSQGKFILKPMGSIAYKLGRLAYQKSDFVISLRPKNIWDIAGGTLLCQEAGLKFYSQGKEVTSVEKIYQPPLLWCHEELFSELSEIFP